MAMEVDEEPRLIDLFRPFASPTTDDHSTAILSAEAACPSKAKGGVDGIVTTTSSALLLSGKLLVDEHFPESKDYDGRNSMVVISLMISTHYHPSPSFVRLVIAASSESC